MNKKQRDRKKTDTLRKLCKSDNEYYADAVSGVVYVGKLRERKNVTAPTEKEIRDAKRSPLTRCLLRGSIFLATAVTLAALAYVCYVSGVGRGTADRLNKADQEQTNHIKDTYPKSPYRDDSGD